MRLDEDLKAMGATRASADLCLYTWDHSENGRVYILV